jgi:hypothetical protein
LLVSLYHLDADKDSLNVISFTLIQPNGLRNEPMDVAISVDDFYTFTLESVLEPLPQVYYSNLNLKTTKFAVKNLIYFYSVFPGSVAL